MWNNTVLMSVIPPHIYYFMSISYIENLLTSKVNKYALSF